jgi:hypothetical protein
MFAAMQRPPQTLPGLSLTRAFLMVICQRKIPSNAMSQCAARTSFALALSLTAKFTVMEATRIVCLTQTIAKQTPIAGQSTRGLTTSSQLEELDALFP